MLIHDLTLQLLDIFMLDVAVARVAKGELLEMKIKHCFFVGFGVDFSYHFR